MNETTKIDLVPCAICADHYVHSSQGPDCIKCVTQFGPMLSKAFSDPFNYAMGLTNGRIIRFEQAKYCGYEWVLLTGITTFDFDPPDTYIGFLCPRGVQIRLKEIIWVADAPEGS